MNPLRSIILACFVLSGLLSAASPAGQAPQAKFTAVWINDRPLEEEVYVKNVQGLPTLLMVGSRSRGAPVSVASGGQPIIFSKKVIVPPKTPAEAPTETFVPIGEIAWPLGGTRTALALLAFNKRPDGTLQIMGKLIDDDIKQFPVNSVEVVNFGGVDIVCQFPDGIKEIPQGSVIYSNYPENLNPGDPNIMLYPIKIADSATREILFSSLIEPRVGSRTLLIIYPIKTIEGIQQAMKPILDYPKPEVSVKKF